MKKVLTFILVVVFTLSFVFVGINTSANAASSSTRDAEGKYVPRAFDEDFDTVYDNCDTEEGYLHAVFNNGLGITEDDAIFKSCSNFNEQGTYSYLVFKMRTTDTAKLADLKLSFRKADGMPFITIPFADLLDPDLDAFKDLDKELSSEYQVYVINLNDSLDGLYYDAEKTVAGDNKFLGFHLVSAATSEDLRTLEIEEVYFSNDPLTTGYAANGQNALMDSFQRTNVNLAPDGVYWCGSACGQIIYGTSVVSTSAYELTLKEANTYENLVLSLRGENGGESVKVTINGTEYDLAALKDTADIVLPALTNGFVNYVINLAANGITKEFTTVKVSSTGVVYVDAVFGTNLEISEANPTYPVLDAEIQMYDNFNREVLGALGEWTAENPVAIDNGFDYLISYAGLDHLKIQNEALVFDNVENPVDYLNYKSNASTRFNDGSFPYVVFKVKVSDGGLLDNLRFQTLEDDAPKGPIVWANDIYSAKNLKVAKIGQEDYPYVTEDGWTYLIVDLALNGMSTKPSGLDIYWGGTGKLYIGSIFYAKSRQIKLNEETKITFDDFERETLVASENEWWIDSNASIVEGDLVLAATGAGYNYFRGAAKQGFQNKDAEHPYLVLTMKAEEGATLKTLRIETISTDTPHVWVKDGGIYLADGSVLSVDALTEEYQTFVIDLAKSGFAKGIEGIGFGYDGEGESGKLHIASIEFVEDIPFDYTVASSMITFDDFERETLVASENEWWIDSNASIVEGDLVLTARGAGYNYFRGAAKQGFQNKDAEHPYLVLTMKAEDGATLKTLRIETISTDTPHVWVKDGGIYLADGSVLSVDALTEEYQTFVIDLAKSGFAKGIEGIGFGYDGEGESGKLHIASIAFSAEHTALMDTEVLAKEVAAATLEQPVIKISGNTLSFNAVVGASSYELYQGTTKVATYKVTDSFEKDLSKNVVGSYKYVVKALGNGVTVLDSVSTTETVYNVTITKFSVTGQKVNFTNSEEFSAADIKVAYETSNGQKVELTAADFAIDSSKYVKGQAGDYEIKVTSDFGSFNYQVTVAGGQTTTNSCFNASAVQLMISLISVCSLFALIIKKNK